MTVIAHDECKLHRNKSLVTDYTISRVKQKQWTSCE